MASDGAIIYNTEQLEHCGLDPATALTIARHISETLESMQAKEQEGETMQNEDVRNRAEYLLKRTAERIEDGQKRLNRLKEWAEDSKKRFNEEQASYKAQLQADGYSDEEVMTYLRENSDAESWSMHENYYSKIDDTEKELELLQQDKTIYEYFIEHNKEEGE